ncbi:DUF4143 domain-containing protein [Accumulibacter sp.]|uniref:ATP-binding protein n=1 Tax=Accumulibacter sp. TaxID=2053492 RepID=UPI0025EB5C04|nr:DUF4143 domain-containing protein [Accumulibacter sp.]MCM8611187.1 ATP-binding protein [Accumulibacter sp.]MCM8634333.1 ATP-binding protein [Accumulibacter sp.]MCM8641635.1 ATP-binding protein [Accumulibacter sp.]
MSILIDLAGYYPIVAITGPRHSGKTTLARATFPDKPYASLEDPDVRALAATDPRGFYPPLHDRAIPPHVWFSDYLATYVERDLRSLLQVRERDHFHRFVLMCAARSGQLLNLSALAADCGITHNTAHAWIGVLEASYIATRLTPFHRNLGKRLTRTPRLYLLDPGLAAWLAGVRGAPELAVGSLLGPLFETWVVSEFLKRRRNGLHPEELHFWRDDAEFEFRQVDRQEQQVASGQRFDQ